MNISSGCKSQKLPPKDQQAANNFLNFQARLHLSQLQHFWQTRQGYFYEIISFPCQLLISVFSSNLTPSSLCSFPFFLASFAFLSFLATAKVIKHASQQYLEHCGMHIALELFTLLIALFYFSFRQILQRQMMIVNLHMQFFKRMGSGRDVGLFGIVGTYFLGLYFFNLLQRFDSFTQMAHRIFLRHKRTALFETLLLTYQQLFEAFVIVLFADERFKQFLINHETRKALLQRHYTMSIFYFLYKHNRFLQNIRIPFYQLLANKFAQCLLMVRVDLQTKRTNYHFLLSQWVLLFWILRSQIAPFLSHYLLDFLYFSQFRFGLAKQGLNFNRL